MTDYENEISLKLSIIRNELSQLPDGKLVYSRTGNYIRWYVCHNGKYEYLRKRERSLLIKLVAKKYFTDFAKCLEEESKAFKRYQKKHMLTLACREKYLADDSVYASLLHEAAVENATDCKWEDREYEKSSYMPQRLIFKTKKGDFVRSKSEAMIADALFVRGIPYRYEDTIKIDGITYHPDFTIFDQKTGKVLYWEHLGMMDSPGYIGSSYTRLRTFAEAGLIPTINLIITVETSSEPLCLEKIEETIRRYFGEDLFL